MGIRAYVFDDDLLGKMWFYHNIAIIDVHNIVKTAKEIEMEDVELGYPSHFDTDVMAQTVLTMVHELRHLMLDTNIVLSEEEYPVNESAEDAVEEFACSIIHKHGCDIF